MEEIFALVIVILFVILLYKVILDTEPSPRRLYFDNNGTTYPYPETLRDMKLYSCLGNASANYASKAREILENTSKIIKCWLKAPDDYKIVFNSGASEGNNTILRAVVDVYWQRHGCSPHILISEYEHKTSLDCVKTLHSQGRVKVDYLKPDISGLITVPEVLAKIGEDTILVSVILAHNELGSVNPIHSIFSEVKKRNKRILCHTDAVQAFTKYQFTVKYIDALTISFHKLHGPTGVGCLVLSPEATNYVKESPLIHGAQNDGLRGGTENISGIAGCRAAMLRHFNRRAEKNKVLRKWKNNLANTLACYYDIGKFEDYYSNTFQGKEHSKRRAAVVFLGPTGEKGLPSLNPYLTTPHTLLFSIVKYTGIKEHFCNIKLKKSLLNKGIVVSIGSACNTSSPEPSHTLFAIGAPYIIRCGVIRVSFGDLNTEEECRYLCKVLIDTINEQL